MDYNLPDTLVFKIEEYEEYKLIDTTLYILYDTRSERYVIRGKRLSTSSSTSYPYSFESESARDLVDFIELIICSKNIQSALWDVTSCHPTAFASANLSNTPLQSK